MWLDPMTWIKESHATDFMFSTESSNIALVPFTDTGSQRNREIHKIEKQESIEKFLVFWWRMKMFVNRTPVWLTTPALGLEPRPLRLKVSSQNRDTYRSPTQGCNMSSCFDAKIYSLLARRRSSQPVQRVYWPENVIYWPEQWRTACVMQYARRHKLQSFRCEWDFCMYPYSVVSCSNNWANRAFVRGSLCLLEQVETRGGMRSFPACTPTH